MATHRPFIFNSLKPTDKSVKIYSNKKSTFTTQDKSISIFYQTTIS